MREIDTEKKDVSGFAGDGGAADAAQVPRVDGRPPVADRAQGFLFKGKGERESDRILKPDQLLCCEFCCSLDTNQKSLR